MAFGHHTGTVPGTTSSSYFSTSGRTEESTSTTSVIKEETVYDVIDANISSSAYGKVIPLLYGTMRLSSNLIWTPGITKETTTTTTTDTTTTTTTDYGYLRM